MIVNLSQCTKILGFKTFLYEKKVALANDNYIN